MKAFNYDFEGFTPGPVQARVVEQHWLVPPGRFEEYAMEPSLPEYIGMPDAYVAVYGIADQVVNESQHQSF